MPATPKAMLRQRWKRRWRLRRLRRKKRWRLLGPRSRRSASTSATLRRTTFNATRALALDYLKAVSRAVGPTEIIKNTHRTTGTRLTMTTLRRALDDLVHAGDVEQVDNSRWQIKGAARPVPLRPVR